ncbi:hypothetical protein [Streptomyces sp. NPDC003395]
MNLNRQPSAIAGAAAEEIRALNHRTMDANAFEQPSDVYRTIGLLLALMQGVPQAIEQTWADLRAMEEADAIRMDDGTDVRERMQEAQAALNEARRLIAASSNFLADATRTLSHMGGQW